MPDQIEELLTRRVQDILPSKESLIKAIQSGQKLKIYQGFDPSKPNLHIGHLVGLLQLKAFQDAGHQIIFLIGDFTGMIGDPTDKSATRPKLTREEVVANAKTYQEQAGKIINFSGDNPAQLKFNSEWLDKLSMADILELSSNVTVQQLLERDMFQKRLQEQKPIFLHEFMYPLLQGYDSVAMEVDIEVGGNDQLFNMMVGRQLEKAIKNKEKSVLTTKLLTDSAGVKIGKTSGNAINLFGDPNDLFGGVMSLPDDVILNTLILATSLSLEEIETIRPLIESDPMTAKKRLAFELVRMCHTQEVAVNAQSHFETTVQKAEIPTDIPVIELNPSEISLLNLIKLALPSESGGQIRRVIAQGGVEYNQQKSVDPNYLLTPKSGDVIKYGKRTYFKLQTK